MKPNLSERQKRAISSFFAVIIVVTLPATSLAGIQPVRAEHQNPESDLLDYTQTSLGPHVNIPNNHEVTFEDLPRDNLAVIYESQDFDTEERTIIIRYTFNISDCSGSAGISTGITEIDTPTDTSQLSGLRIGCNSVTVRNGFDGHDFHKNGEQVATISQNQEYDIEIRYNYGSANMTIEVDGQTVTAQYPAAKKANIVPFVNDNTGVSTETISGEITDYSLNFVDIKNIGQDFNTYTKIEGADTFNVSQNWASGSFQPDDGYGLYKDNVGANGDNLKIEYEFFLSPSSSPNSDVITGVGYAPSNTEQVVGTIWRDDTALNQRNLYFRAEGGPAPLGQKYFVTDYVYYNNGTHITYIYEDKDRTQVYNRLESPFPAGENLTDIWAFSAFTSGQNADVTFNIGNLEIQRTETADIADDLTTWTENDPDDRISKTKNFVSYEDLDMNNDQYLLNQSGPGTDTATLDYTVYVDSFSDRGHHSTGFSDTIEGGRNPGTFTGVHILPSISTVRIYVGSSFKGDLLTNFSTETFYHITIKKKESTVEFEVYSDADRTNLLNSLSFSYDNTTDYQYVYAVATENNNDEFQDLSGMVHIGNISQSVTFVDPYSGNITLDVNPWMDHGDTQEYKVLADNGSNVASQSTVTSGNTTVITVNTGTQELEATSDESINKKVEISAEFGDATDTENVTVANRTIGNIGILPPSQRPGAVIGIDDPQAAYGIGSEIQWILLAVFIGAVGAWKARNEWIGVGVITGALILFWTVGHVSLGYTIVGVFYAIFTGYQLVRTPSRSDTKVGAGIDNFP